MKLPKMHKGGHNERPQGERPSVPPPQPQASNELYQRQQSDRWLDHYCEVQVDRDRWRRMMRILISVDATDRSETDLICLAVRERDLDAARRALEVTE